MNNKITFPELVEKLADSTNSSKRVCELFLKELFATISQELIDGKNVKVKKLGTFKLAKVNARKSIDVNTGEEIEIPVHNKLIFVPDNSLADAINTPFVNFETTVLSDDITDEDLKAVDNADAVEDEPEKVEDSNDNEESSGEEDGTQPEAFIITPPPFKIADEESPAAEPIEEESLSTEAAEEEAPASDDQPTPPPFNKEEPVEQEQPVEQDEQTVEEEQPVEQEEQSVEEQPVEQAQQSVEQENPETEQPAETQPADDNEDDGFVSPQYYANYEIEEKVQEASKKAMLKGFLWGVIVTVAACAVVGYVVYSNMSKG